MKEDFPNPSLFLESTQEVFDWTSRLFKRFPTWVDARFIKGIYAVLGAGTFSFLKERSAFHLKRIFAIQFLLQKKASQREDQKKKQRILVRVFSYQSHLCIAIAYLRKENSLTDEIILEVAKQKVPALKKVERSFYQWSDQDLSHSFCYLEVEKVRGKELLVLEIKALESYLKHELYHYTSESVIFWPYNHEEAFKQLLVLGNELSSVNDFPQVSIHFQKQTAYQLEFLIYLARPRAIVSQETTMTKNHFFPSAQLVVHLKKELNFKIPALLEIFSLLIPLNRCKKGVVINLLYAREYIAKVLEGVIGVFRDYNGGLFETQKNRFEELSRLFAEKIPNFSLFGEALFYALTPVETQICLDKAIFEQLFMGVSQTLKAPASFLNNPNPYVLVLRPQNHEQLVSCLDLSKTLQTEKKVVAYANIKILSEDYLCLLSERSDQLNDIQDQLTSHSTLLGINTTLRLLIQSGDIPTFNPFYLSSELNGRTIVKFIFEGLMRLGIKGRIECAGCINVKPSENKRSYLFQIRPHYWSNGEKVTAFQYEKTWKKNLLEGDNLNLFYLIKHADAIRRGDEKIENLGVKALDQEYLQVDLEKEDPFFLERMTHPLFFPLSDGPSEPKNFNGPYFVNEKDEEKILLEKNPYYWDEKKIFFKKIEIQLGGDTCKAYTQFKNKKLDWFGDPFIRDHHLSSSKSTSNKKEILRPYLLYLNATHFPLSSSLIRSALSYAIDREFIGNHIYDRCRPLTTMLPKKMSLSSIPAITYDPSKARSLFREGLEKLGFTKKTFPTLKLIYSCKDKEKKLAEYLKEKWETTFGIKVDIDIKKWDLFCQQVERGSFQVGGSFKSFMFAYSPLPFLESFASKKSNYSCWTDVRYISYLNKAKKACSKKEYLNSLLAAEKILLDNMPVIPLVTDTYFYIHHPELQDYVIDQEGVVDFRFASYKIN